MSYLTIAGGILALLLILVVLIWAFTLPKQDQGSHYRPMADADGEIIGVVDMRVRRKEPS